MKKMRTTIVALLVLAAMATLVAAQEAFSDPTSKLIWDKIIPIAQGVLTSVAAVVVIFVAARLQSGDPEKVDEAKKALIAVGISVLVIWIGPLMIKWLVGVIRGG